MNRLPRFTVYLLLSERGEIYTGFTGSLRARLKAHNSPDNDGWTKGRRWHLLAVRQFLDQASALMVEKQLKRQRWAKLNWLKRERPRLRKLCRRHGISHKLAD